MSPQQRRTAFVRRAGGLALVAVLAGAAVGFSTPRSEGGAGTMACSGELVNQVKMSSGRADFGGDPHLAGAPTGSGRLCWGNGGAILEGQLYYDDLLKAGCAHITVEFQNANPTPQRLSLFTQKVCSPGGLRQTSIFSQVAGSTTDRSKRVGRVTIQLFISATATGAKTSVGFRAFSR